MRKLRPHMDSQISVSGSANAELATGSVIGELFVSASAQYLAGTDSPRRRSGASAGGALEHP